MKIPIHSYRKDVNAFLNNLNDIINSDTFDYENDLFINSNQKNVSTMINLDFEAQDIIHSLKELDVSNYSETLVDSKYPEKFIKLFVFGKVICNYEIYIKISEKDFPRRRVICLSFHFPSKQINYPYT